jgi:2'-5' RNA ligase
MGPVDASVETEPRHAPENAAEIGAARSPGTTLGEAAESGVPPAAKSTAAQPSESGTVHEIAPQRRRVFFALWPDEATRGTVSRATRRAVRLSGGRPTAKRNLHITVAFLGVVDAKGLERAVSVPPLGTGGFELVLDRLGNWREPRVLWLAPSVVPSELAALERELWAGLEEQGFEREARIYRPHLTLARRAREVGEPIAPISWTAAALTLVESVPLRHGVHYEPLQEWPL